MDVKTLDYVAFAGGDYRRRPLDAAWVLAQFPPDLDAALASPPPPETDRRIGSVWLSCLADVAGPRATLGARTGQRPPGARSRRPRQEAP